MRQRLSRLFDPADADADADAGGGGGDVAGWDGTEFGLRPLPGVSSSPRRHWPSSSRHGDVVASARSVAAPAAEPPAHIGASELGASPPGGYAGLPGADESDRTLRARLPGPGAFDPGRRGVRALAVVAVVVVLGAGFWAWRSRPHAEPVRPAGSAAPAALPEAAAPVGSASAGGGGELVVAVAGKVRRPGLVRVPPGARVADVVEAAGGALPGVDLALLNPARKVTDGELVVVGATAAPPAAAGAPAGPAGEGAAPGGPVNLNTATLAQLDALPGVGPVLAQRILAHREQHGGFRSVADLRQVEGIGDARYEQLKELVTV